ncbi:MAG: hypothetical protein SGILL_002356 [Bacillariaceae sp.]
MTTRAIQREQEKLSRSKDVKERIGPIVDRLKMSLSKIEALEASMERIQGQAEPQQTKGVESVANERQPSALITPGKSKELMHSSMELVKRKLLRLRRMEETLAVSEDRRHNLQHLMLQVSLSKPSLELVAAKRQNCQISNQASEFEQQNQILKEKSLLVDDLQIQNDSLLVKIDELVLLEEQLKQTRRERDDLKGDLIERQAQISQQADRCDELECQVEHMKVLCDEMMSNLEQQEDRNAVLEQELIETRKTARRERLQPPVIQLLERKGSVATELTSSFSEAMHREDDNSFDSSFSFCSASARILNSSMLDDEHSREQLASPMVCRAKSRGMGDDAQSSMLETLMATIEALDRENAQLREEKHNAIGKYNAQNHEMKHQADALRDLKLRIQKSERPTDSKTVDIGLPIIRENGQTGGDEEKTGSFFQKLLSN